MRVQTTISLKGCKFQIRVEIQVSVSSVNFRILDSNKTKGGHRIVPEFNGANYRDLDCSTCSQ